MIRVPRRAMLVLVIAGTVFGIPAAAAAAVHPARAAQTAQAAGTPAATPEGVCQVPGIGDIGGVLGFCSSGSSGLIGDLNNICQPSVPSPEPARGGIDSMVEPPASQNTGNTSTLYNNYGLAGQSWAAYDMQCSDMTSLIGNNVAGMVFDAAKAIDRVTITVYQSAAGDGILSWLKNVVDKLISGLGNAIYFPYLAPVVILGAIWLAWQGLIRKRATRTIEGTIWMVVACAAAIWLIGRPGDFTGIGTTVSNGVTQVFNVAFSKLPSPGGSSCVPVQPGDPQSAGTSFVFAQGNDIVGQNANELWTVLVCKPWLDGEFGTSQFATTPGGQRTLVNDYGRQLLWAQAIAANENPTPDLLKAKQSTYAGIAADMKLNHPDIYPLFQGKQWTSRLEMAFAALFAALVAGVLVLLIAVTLIILKLGFLLLLVAGPFFLIIGTHPGFGRVIAIRWFEMLVGVLMKMVAITLVLSILLYCYSLIMGTSDAVLPWALKIMMIALVTVAVFIYRKPFQHLFSAVGYGAMGSEERAEIGLRQAGSTFRRATVQGATAAIPGVGAYRVGRWARRNPAQAASLAADIAIVAGTAGAGAAARGGAARAGAGGTAAAAADAAGADGQMLRPQPDGQGQPEASRETAGSSPGVRPNAGQRARVWADAGADGPGQAAPPLHLPSRAGADPKGPPSGWARNAGASPSRPGVAPPRPPAARSTAPQPAAQRPPAPRATPPAPAPAPAAPRSAPGGGNGASRASRGGNGGFTARNGRSHWQPGPVRPSGGWSGGTASRAGSGEAAPQAGPPSALGNGNGQDQAAGGEAPATPFWLRPIRRKK